MDGKRSQSEKGGKHGRYGSIQGVSERPYATVEAVKKSIKEENIEEAERLIDELIEDTQNNIED